MSLSATDPGALFEQLETARAHFRVLLVGEQLEPRSIARPPGSSKSWHRREHSRLARSVGRWSCSGLPARFSGEVDEAVTGSLGENPCLCRTAPSRHWPAHGIPGGKKGGPCVHGPSGLRLERACRKVLRNPRFPVPPETPRRRPRRSPTPCRHARRMRGRWRKVRAEPEGMRVVVADDCGPAAAFGAMGVDQRLRIDLEMAGLVRGDVRGGRGLRGCPRAAQQRGRRPRRVLLRRRAPTRLRRHGENSYVMGPPSFVILARPGSVRFYSCLRLGPGAGADERLEVHP